MRSFIFPDRASLHLIADAFRYIGLFLAIVGVIVLIGSALWYGTASRGSGIVVGSAHDRAGNERLLVRFTDGNGDEHEVEISLISTNHSMIPNQEFRLLYHQDAPNRVVIDSFFEKWFVGGFLMVWGAFLWIILGVAAKWLSQNRLSEQAAPHNGA